MPRKRNPNAYRDDGAPKYVRCYDSGESGARYIVVFTRTNDGVCRYLGMSGAPFHPQGVCQHGESLFPIDRPRYGHLGKRVDFGALPADCQRAVMLDYRELWG